MVLLPAIWTDGSGTVTPAMPQLIPMAVVFTLLLLTWGTIHQWFVLIGGRTAGTFSIILFIMATTIPAAGAFKKESEWIVSFSPARHFGYWMGASEPAFSYLVLVALYGAVFFIFWHLLRKRMRHLETWIDMKLRLMGVPEP